MLSIDSRTKDCQRIAAGRRRWHAAAVLAAMRLGVPVLLLHLALAALHNGHVGGAGVVMLIAALAGLLASLASRASLAKLGWLGLIKHCLIFSRRAVQARASARARALARVINNAFCIFRRRLELIQAAAIVLIGNRLLPTACISPRIKSQRPN